MSYKVWRKQSDNSVVGVCEAEYTAFEPGGDLSSYTVSLEAKLPVMPLPPKSTSQLKKDALLADPSVPQSVKDYLGVV